MVAIVQATSASRLQLESVRVVPDFASVLHETAAATMVGLDMPIGLPDAAERGGRVCEREARMRLSPRRCSCVFSAPVRAALAASDYSTALSIHRNSSAASIGLSKQVYNLFDKLRDVDAAITPLVQTRVREIHPELGFAAMNRSVPLTPKKSAAGRAARLALLQRFGLAPPATPAGAKHDDLLDALAAAWSAARLAHDTGESLPFAAPRDAHGLLMQISY